MTRAIVEDCNETVLAAGLDPLLILSFDSILNPINGAGHYHPNHNESPEE